MNRWKRVIISSLTGLMVAYGGFTVWRTTPIYQAVKAPPSGFSHGTIRLDETLGYRSPKSQDSIMSSREGKKIPLSFDAYGCRETPPLPDAAKSIVTIGCSFTFGDGCSDEESYPWKLQSLSGYKVYNAGFSGYGLAQMLLRAEEMMKEVHPEFLVVQLSPWLAKRSMSHFAPASHALAPTVPYFAQREGKLEVQHPVFVGNNIGESLASYAGTDRGVLDFLGFTFGVVFPEMVAYDVKLTWTRLGILVGLTATPAESRDAVEAHAIESFESLASEYDAKLVFLLIHDGLEEPRFKSGPGHAMLTYADADAALLEALEDHTEDGYRRAYNFWRDGKLVDRHPNDRANRLIAETVYQAISTLERPSGLEERVGKRSDPG